MKCFQVIKDVLDDLYQQIPGATENEKDNEVVRRRHLLSEQYGKLREGVQIDYGDPVTRFAYVYTYTAAHANIVYDRVRLSDDLGAMFAGSKLEVACLGGGPGSDFLGLLKYMQLTNKPARLRCALYDREPMWGEAWNGVDDRVGTSVSTVFQPLDICDPRTQVYAPLYKADIFTSVYFLSEVYGIQEQASTFFDHLLSRARSGSMFLVVDNDRPEFFDWFDLLVAWNNVGITLLDSGSSDYRIESEEQKSDLGRYFDKFGSPRLTARMAYRILRKQ